MAFESSRFCQNQLQRRNTVDVIEVFVELVVFAQPVVDQPRQFICLIEINYCVDVVQEGGVRVHGAQ